MYKIKFFVLGLVALTFAANTGFAGSESAEKEAASVVAKPFGDAQAGKSKAAVCGACHGRDGNSAIASNPKLAGQSAKYLYKQMKDFQSGARKDPVMSSQVKGISDQDLKNIAAYYEEQEGKSGVVKKDLFELGEKIYRGGNAETGLSACIACHGPAGKGMSAAAFPALAGQHAQYTEKQLKAFRAAGRGDHKGQKRTNDGEEGAIGMMQGVAAKMSDDEIEAVSSYIQGLR